MPVFEFFLMNLIVILSTSLLCRIFLSGRDIADYCIGWFITYLLQIILGLEILGILGLISSKNVLFLNTVFLVFVFLLSKNKRTQKKAYFVSRVQDLLSRIKLSKLEVFCIAVIISFSVVKIFVNLVNPPFGWDSLNYHFTFAVEWLKHGNLSVPPTVFDDPGPSYYPINGSLFYLWLMLPFKNVFLADLGQMPFFILSAFSVFAIAGKIGLEKKHAFYATVLFILVPNFFKQLQIAYVDVMVAAFLLTAINYLLALSKDFSLKNTLFFSASLGLAIGTKTTALPFAFLLFIPFLVLSFTRKEIKNSPFLFFTVGLLILATGGYSYLRNLIMTGNPLYPLNFNILNLQIFKGVIDNQIYRTGIRPGDYSIAKILFSEGLGAQTVLFFLPALLMGLVVFIIKNKERAGFLLYYFMSLPILFFLIYRFLMPIPNLRYIYAIFGITSVIAFYLLATMRLAKNAIIAFFTVCVLASMGELAKKTELISSLILTVSLFFIICILLKYIPRIKLKKINFYFFVVFLVVFIFSLQFLERDYIKNEFSRYVKMTKYSGFWPEATKAWLWLNENTTSANIAYAGRPVPFPLYGSGFKNNVYYVSVNKTDPARLHDFKGSKYIWGFRQDNGKFDNYEASYNYRGNAVYDDWLINLEKRNTDYLFVYSLLKIKNINQFPLENDWAEKHPDRFKLSFSNDTIKIYKLIK
jgi:hypothetical protein